MFPSSDRGRRQALDSLLAMRTAAGYTLPGPVLSAADAAERAGALAVDQPPRLHPADVASEIVGQLTQGAEADLGAAAETIMDDRRRGERADIAPQLAQLVGEQASTRAVSVATQHADEIIRECLAPAFAETLDTARGHAASLAGYPVDEAGGWDAPAGVRKARAGLAGLAERADLLRHAWRAARGLAGREPERDEAGVFSEFEDRLALHPGLAPTSPVPPLNLPVDPVAGLLWMVTTAAPGRPWLPTVEEQDQAWLVAYGAAAEERRGRHVAALAWGGVNA